MDHVITADDSEDMEIHSTWLNWTMTLSHFFDQKDSEQITKVINELRDKITGKFDAS
jgi:hypothetical protein